MVYAEYIVGDYDCRRNLLCGIHGTMGQITESFISSSTEAVNLCIFMLGVIGVWNGMMEIAVKSGLMKKIAKTMYPFYPLVISRHTTPP